MNPLLPILLSTAIADGSAVTLKVDLSALPEAADDNIEQWVLDDATRALDASGHQIADDAEHTIEVAISWYGKDNLETLVTVALDGQPPVEIRCSVCDEDEWLPKMATEVARLADTIDEQSESAVSASDTNEPDEPLRRTEPHSKQPAQTDTPPRLTWLGGVGIGAGLAGVGLVATGVYDLTREPELSQSDDDPRVSTEKTLKRRGAVFLVAGGLAAIGGVAALVVDVRRQKRKRRISVVPSAGPAFTGFQLRGKF